MCTVSSPSHTRSVSRNHPNPLAEHQDQATERKMQGGAMRCTRAWRDVKDQTVESWVVFWWSFILLIFSRLQVDLGAFLLICGSFLMAFGVPSVDLWWFPSGFSVCWVLVNIVESERSSVLKMLSLSEPYGQRRTFSERKIKANQCNQGVRPMSLNGSYLQPTTKHFSSLRNTSPAHPQALPSGERSTLPLCFIKPGLAPLEAEPSSFACPHRKDSLEGTHRRCEFQRISNLWSPRPSHTDRYRKETDSWLAHAQYRC